MRLNKVILYSTSTVNLYQMALNFMQEIHSKASPQNQMFTLPPPWISIKWHWILCKKSTQRLHHKIKCLLYLYRESLSNGIEFYARNPFKSFTTKSNAYSTSTVNLYQMALNFMQEIHSKASPQNQMLTLPPPWISIKWHWILCKKSIQRLHHKIKCLLYIHHESL